MKIPRGGGGARAWQLFRKPGSLQKLNQRVSLGRNEPNIFLSVNIFIHTCQTRISALTNLICLNSQSSSLRYIQVHLLREKIDLETDVPGPRPVSCDKRERRYRQSFTPHLGA